MTRSDRYASVAGSRVPRTLLIIVISSFALAACSAKPSESSSKPSASPTSVGPGNSTLPPGGTGTDNSEKGIAFDLLTHCGIYELIYDGKWYVRAKGRLSDSKGNPPSGWGNPTQPGRLVVNGDSAAFHDKQGHEELFALQPDQNRPHSPCA